VLNAFVYDCVKTTFGVRCFNYQRTVLSSGRSGAFAMANKLWPSVSRCFGNAGGQVTVGYLLLWSV